MRVKARVPFVVGAVGALALPPRAVACVMPMHMAICTATHARRPQLDGVAAQTSHTVTFSRLGGPPFAAVRRHAFRSNPIAWLSRQRILQMSQRELLRVPTYISCRPHTCQCHTSCKSVWLHSAFHV